jgi:hypothetical protein
MLDDTDLLMLEPELFRALILLWLMAAENEGTLPDLYKIAFRLRMPEKEISRVLQRLDHYIETESRVSLDTIREIEIEKERYIVHSEEGTFDKDFLEFYAKYPKKVGKAAALRAYLKARKQVSHETIMAGLARVLTSRQWADRKFIPFPATWLNRGGWEDEMEQTGDLWKEAIL